MSGLPLQVIPVYAYPADNRGPLAVRQTGWNDLLGGVEQGAGASALTHEVFRDTPFLMSFFRANQNDSLSFSYQMSHGWLPGTTVHPHVHVIPMANPAVAQNVYMIGQYAWIDVGSGKLPANAGWTVMPPTVLTINPGEDFEEKIISLPAIVPPAAMKESAILLFYIQRNGANVLDTYTTAKVGGTASANLGLLSFDCHIQVEKSGTQEEFP